MKTILKVSVNAQVDILLGQIKAQNDLAYYHHNRCLALTSLESETNNLKYKDRCDESVALWNAHSCMAHTLAKAVHDIRYDNLGETPQVKGYLHFPIVVYGIKYDCERYAHDPRYTEVGEGYNQFYQTQKQD